MTKTEKVFYTICFGIMIVLTFVNLGFWVGILTLLPLFNIAYSLAIFNNYTKSVNVSDHWAVCKAIWFVYCMVLIFYGCAIDPETRAFNLTLGLYDDYIEPEAIVYYDGPYPMNTFTPREIDSFGCYFDNCSKYDKAPERWDHYTVAVKNQFIIQYGPEKVRGIINLMHEPGYSYGRGSWNYVKPATRPALPCEGGRIKPPKKNE